ncbi:MAG: T9SS type A sorting domain-containing protein [Dysgonamonadaceae bacterium]|nr:T9SS type A sorting domain-containing protein [Dysgonamonadaceae bacterium]
MKRLVFLIGLWRLSGILTTEIQAQLWGPIAGGVVYEISHNGRYVTGLTHSSNGRGFVWDTQSGVVEDLGQSVYPYCVTDDGLIVGNFNDTINGVALSSGGYREQGASRWSSLGAGLFIEPTASNGSSVRRITPDGQTIVGYSKKPTDDYIPTLPYCWSKNETGGWTGAEWAHPDDIKQGNIIDIADDGQTAVGFIHSDGGRKAILWKSPINYELPFSPDAYSEYVCVSANGKYAGFSHNGGDADPSAGIHNLESAEITFIPEGIRVNAVDNNGLAFGVYRPNGIDRAFIWDKKWGFMDFGDFIVSYTDTTELEPIKSTSLWQALTDKTVTFSINAVTPEGWTFAICLQTGYDGEAYVLKINPVTLYPFPKNLSTDIPVADRNNAILNWETPEPENGEIPTGYAIYRNQQLLTTVNQESLTYTDANISPPGYYNYQVTAIYGDKHSNFSNTAQAVIVNNYDLPLRENFDKLNLTANYWTTETNHRSLPIEWHVYSNAGVENGTGLVFRLNNLEFFPNKEFSASLTSKYLDATNASRIFLSFLVKPDYYMETSLTPDTLLIDVYDGNEWQNVDKYTFGLSMEWKADILDLSETAAGKLFRVRFRITGANHTVSAKSICFDDITVATSPPDGNAVSQNLPTEKTENNVRLAWKNPQTNLYALTYAHSPKRYSIGNEGKNFIAANHFDTTDINLYKGKYLTSITVYVNRKIASPTVATQLKQAVFVDGQRIVDKAIDSFTPNAWNTFLLDNPIALDGKDLKFGIEVTAHDTSEEPIGVDGARRPVSGKGDIYSEDGGLSWKTLTDARFVNNWAIIGNVSDSATVEAKPATDIIGYNVYADGVKLNDDLIFGQSFETAVVGETYTIRTYSPATGFGRIEDSGNPNTGVLPPSKTRSVAAVYPNPVGDVLFIRSESPVERLSVYDMTGRLCKEGAQGISSLPVNDLNAGVYFVKIKTAAGESVHKIFIKRAE